MSIDQNHALTQPPYLSVVLPVYNEAEHLGVFIPDLINTLMEENRSFEIIAVNDGSQDQSERVLLSLRAHYPQQLRVFSHVINKGNGAALRTGIRLALGEVVVCMDADGQHSPREMYKLLRLVPPYDMVVGARTQSYAGKWYRNLANRFYNRFATWLTQYEIKDLTSGYRAMRRQAVQHFLPLYPARFSSPATVTIAFLKAGYSVAYAPMDVLPRKAGKSSINLWRDGSRFVVIILRMIMLFDPLRIFIPVTFGLSVLGLATMLAGVWAAGRLIVPGSSVVLFIAALLSILLGLVSTQVTSNLIPYYGDDYIHTYDAVDSPAIDLGQENSLDEHPAS